MATCIRAVGSNVHLDDYVVFDMVVIASLHPHGSVLRQNDNTGVIRSHTNLVLCTNHSHRFFAAQFAFLDSETLIAVVKHGSYGSHNHFLTCRHIRCAAHHLEDVSSLVVNGSALCFHSPHIDCCDVHVIGVRVGHTSQHFADYQAF